MNYKLLTCKSILRPFRALLDHARFLRPIVQIGREKFKVSLDVRQFNKDELRIKARPESIIIEGKQERKIPNGYVIRQFHRKYKLPAGCNPCTVYSTLTDDGMLTVTAPRNISHDPNTPIEFPVPIKFCGPDNRTDPQCIQSDVPINICDYYLKRPKTSVHKNKPSDEGPQDPPPKC